MSFEEYILKKIQSFTLVALLQAEMQMGKSTFAWYLMDDLSQQKFGKPWDFKRFCARNFEEFFNMMDKYDNELICYEEASKDISVEEWYSQLNQFFTRLIQTQAYKHNFYLLVFPNSLGISARQRRFIKLGMEIQQKIDEPDLKAVIVRPTIYKRTYWKLDEDDLQYIFIPTVYVKYTDEDLAKSKLYTDWLIDTLKKDVMSDTKQDLKDMIKKKKMKCAICFSKRGLTKAGNAYLCKKHMDYVTG
jgi:hypothetical protein